MPKVLVIGGSGYLGSHLVLWLSRQGHKVRYTYNSNESSELIDATSQDNPVKGYKVDLVTGEGLGDFFSKCSQVDAIVNCAAVSQPIVCEKDEDFAASVNVPTQILEMCERQRDEKGSCPLFIHISTDQVYDGSSKEGGMWNEGDATAPINAYGRTKLAAEAAVRDRWENHVILRSSIIYGPESPVPVGRPLFLQFVEGQLKEGVATDYFTDEFRSPVYVEDIAQTISMILTRAGLSNHAPLTMQRDGESGDFVAEGAVPFGFSRVFNLGGPERLSRYDMARVVARCFDYENEDGLCVPSTSASADRGYLSPPDISMDVTRLVTELKIKLTTFEEAVRKIYKIPMRPSMQLAREGSGRGSGGEAGAPIAGNPTS